MHVAFEKNCEFFKVYDYEVFDSINEVILKQLLVIKDDGEGFKEVFPGLSSKHLAGLRYFILRVYKPSLKDGKSSPRSHSSTQIEMMHKTWPKQHFNDALNHT